MKALYINYLYKNNNRLIIYIAFIAINAIFSTINSFQALYLSIIINNFHVTNDEFTKTLPLSLKDHIKAQLIFMMTVTFMTIATIVIISFIQPMQIQKLISGLGASIIVPVSLTIKDYIHKNKNHLSMIFIIIFTIANLLAIQVSEMFFPLVLLATTIINSIFVYTLFVYNMKKNYKEDYYVKGK